MSMVRLIQEGEEEGVFNKRLDDLGGNDPALKLQDNVDRKSVV